ncbi:MAG TPA: ExeM/NucH family extracellular endonuclease [Nocardioidaceae bacterium]
MIATVGFGLVVSPLAAVPAHAAPDGQGLVISEVYGGGGNTGAPLSNDFVELYNPTDAAIDVDGMSVQYRSSAGTSAQVTSLTGSVPAGGHYLVQQAAGTTVTDKPLPRPDATGTISMSGTNGVVLLVPSTDPFTVTGDLAGHAGLLDMVGYGTAPTSFETANTGVALTNSTAATRSAAGADTDHNANDFDEAAPTPTNSGLVAPPPPPPAELELSIAEIQGTGTASEHVGDIVTTTGVVTAAYPTGGYNGFYIQTEGTGGATDTTPGASDAVFVYGSAATAVVEIGDHVEVTGEVKEYAGTTQVSPASASDVTVLTEPAVAPKALVTELPATEAAREAHEGELLAPSGPFTVTNTYTTNTYAEIGLAAGTTPLIQPTEVEDAQDTAAIAAVQADNAARAITLDDGASVNYTTTGKNTPLPWLSLDNPVRVGAAASFTAPVVLEYRNNTWKFQPTSQVTDDGSAVATFENTRTAAPESVGGELRLATFNVLNYFPTTGEEFVASGAGTCTYYTDREGAPTTTNRCDPDGPRGAADQENLLRQQTKIVAAINKLDASIVSLEEIENSVKFGKDRDFAVDRLVEALNAAAGAGTWAFAPSPAAADLPAPAEEDVIRTAFIYKPAAVELVGASQVLKDEVNFDNAREPLAQAFKPAGAPDSKAFAVIVNHFKSKGDSNPKATGDNANGIQGAFNGDRIRQAEALSAFADSFAAERGTKAVFLTGDLNSYSMEDPMQVLYADGYTQVESDTEGEETYSYSGLSGSLDHVLANDAALAMVTGADIWTINSPESVGFEYSRYNNNITNLYDAGPFRASDHDPEIVGIDVPGFGLKKIQVLGTNDFHGRLTNNAYGTEAGAAVLAGAVEELREEVPATVFAAAGDLIGASTFDSFIAKDKPTIDALNEAGLDVSAVGNHEFDQGYDDLVNRVMAPYDPDTNPFGGAEWEYIGANVHKPGAPESELLEPTWVQQFGDVEVGFIGAVTEHLDELVSPAGIEGVEIEDIVTATNREADALEAAGVDVVVLLVHEGAETTSYESATDPSTEFGEIVNGVDGDVDAIVSGHTHLAYNHEVPVQEWIDEGRDVTTRPVVSSGQYGSNLNQLVFTVDSATGEVVAKSQEILALKTGQTANYPADAATAQIVADAVAEASVLGAEPLGQLAGPFNRAKLANGTTENRGGESTAGNLVAEVQRWATESEIAGAAQIAFMNPGGLRADMKGGLPDEDAYPKTLTYKQAAEMQPFANTLVNMQMTGAQIETLLEQQWQPAGSSRPFLKLGTSAGFTYTYDPAAEAGSRITGMWLDGVAIDPVDSYSVTANSFLAAGGDNFTEFKHASGKKDTGKIDLQAMVDYMAEFAGTTPLAAEPSQGSVGVSFPEQGPVAFPGGELDFTVSSLAFSTAVDVKDSKVRVSLDGDGLGTFPVDNTIGTAVTDEYGVADISVRIPAGTPLGESVLTVTGLTTGTTVPVAVDVLNKATVSASVAPMTYGTDGTVEVSVTSDVPVTGSVEVLDGDDVLGTGTLDETGHVTVTIDGTVLEPGSQVLTVRYLGDADNAAAQTRIPVQVSKAAPTVTGVLSSDTIKVKKGTTQVAVSVTAGEYTPTGAVGVYVDGTLTAVTTLTEGTASATIGGFDTVGTKSVVVRYFGDDFARAAASEPLTLTVQKATPRIRASHRPDDVIVRKTRPTLTVRVSALQEGARGAVVVRTAGRLVAKKRLVDGKVTFLLPRYTRVGEKPVRIRYLGNATVTGRAVSHSVVVVRR